MNFMTENIMYSREYDSKEHEKGCNGKKKVRQFTNVLLVCVILGFILMCPVESAAAIVSNETIVMADPSEQLLPYQGMMKRDPAGVEYMLFPMEAHNLTNYLLTTRGTSKYFLKADIPDDAYLFYVGELSANNTSAAAGICYYNSIAGISVSIHETSFPSDTTTSSGYISPSNLRSDRTYYGYIKNLNQSGVVSGYVHFYYLDMY